MRQPALPPNENYGVRIPSMAWRSAVMNLRKIALLSMRNLGIHRAAAAAGRALGVIFSAHRVQPARATPFQPNAALTITPEFLEAAIIKVRAMGHDIVSLDEAHERLLDAGGSGKNRRPFACFTFDDGYRDNRIWAFPVLAKHGVPHTIYVPVAFADGHGVLWWELLERIVAGNEVVELEGAGKFNTVTTVEKGRAFGKLVQHLNAMAPVAAHALAVRAASRHGIDSDAVCRELMMGWDELAQFSRQKLLTIGGHTASHFRLAKLPFEEAVKEIESGMAGLEARLGLRPAHLSYPFGDPGSAGVREFEIAAKLGLKTAVTTNSGILNGANSGELTSLPRLSLNRVCNDVRCLEVLVSGAPWSLFPSWRR